MAAAIGRAPFLAASCLLLFFLSASLVSGSATGPDCSSAKRLNTKLFCYYGKTTQIDGCLCTHVILPANSDVKLIDGLKQQLSDVKILITVNEFNEGLIKTLKTAKIDGLEIDLRKLDSKNDIKDFISTVRSKIGSDLYLALSIPPKAELLAKYYDMKALTKHADVFILQTAFLGASQNVTFHPSRLSGRWDMQNTDSIVDLVTGLGAPLSKLVIAAPVQGFQFTLQDAKHNTIGSPAVQVKSITREELCAKMSTSGSNWTLERDQDQAGPYIFSKKEWIAFEDPTSIDIKAKYARVRGLAGMALKDLAQDGGLKCGGSLLEAAHTGLSRQSRAPRGALLQSLEREILEPTHRPLDTIQISPYRISRVIDVDGNVHDIRQDTRTEFECARQGYFVHPRSCGRFYRCVKFDQLTDEFNVFEFDCPAGLAFDSRYEVCVWPGSLPHGSACAGSSEIAPVPRERFVCPGRSGYYADPENCRWFFACLDHGKSPLSAYEFRCPFGLVFDESRLLCEWPWLVPTCHNGGALGFEAGQVDFYGGISSQTSVLQTYNGLGALGTVALGGLSGTFVESQPKVYSSAGIGATTGYSIGSGITNGLGAGVGIATGLGIGLDASHREAHISLEDATNRRNQQDEVALRTQFGQGNIDVRYDAGSTGTGASLVQSSGLGASSAFGLDASKTLTGASSVEYHGNAGHSSKAFNSISLGNIAPVHRGYSAVATGLDVGLDVGRANVEISQGGLYAAVPTATAVPVPVIQSQSHFGTAYDGHVVANVPEFQYKIPAGVAYTNISSGYFGGYQYKKPSVSYVQQPALAVQTNYAYQQPLITPVQKTVIQPAVAVVQQQKQAVVQNSYSYHNQEHSGYHYEKPQVSYVQTASVSPASISVTASPPLVQKINLGYEYPKPTVSYVQEPVVSVQSHSYVSSTPKPILQNVNVGYSYPKPTVSYVEQPAVSVQQTYVSSTSKPFVQNVEYSYPKPTLTSYVKQPVVSVGYNYPKQTISYVEQPAVSVQQTYVSSTPKPFVQNVEYSYPKPTLTSYVKQPVSYVQEPVVSVQSHSYVSSTPKPILQNVNVGYSYPKPTVSYVEQPAVSVQQTYVSSTPKPIVQNVEYSYPKPTLTSYVQQPIVSVQPAYVSSTIRPAVQKVSLGYDYPKPTVSFVEQPAVSVQQTHYVSSTPRPAVLEQKIGYDYPKPSVSFVEQPLFDVQKTFVVSSPRPFAKVNVDYDYPKPTVSVQQTYVQPSVQPVVHQAVYKPVVQKVVTPTIQTYVQPSIATVQQPAPFSYHYQQPAVEQTIVPKKAYVTGKEETIYTGYKYEKPPVVFEEKPVVYKQTKAYLQPTQQVYVSSTPKYTQQPIFVTPTPKYDQVSVAVNPFQQYIQKQAVVNFRSDYGVKTVTEKPVYQETYITQSPAISKYSFSSFDDRYSASAPKVAPQPNYETNFYVSSTPKPTYIPQAKVAVSPVNYEQNFYVSSTPKPTYVPQKVAVTPVTYEQNYYVSSTPKPTYVPQKIAVAPVNYEQNFYVSSTPKPTYVPAAKVTAVPVDYEQNFYVSSTPRPTYNPPKVRVTPIAYEQPSYYVSSTPKPTFQSIIAPVKQTEQAFYSYGDRIGSTPNVYSAVKSTAVPVVTQEYSQAPAIAKYSFGSLVDKEENYNNYEYVSSTPRTIQQSTAKYVESYPIEEVEEQYVVSKATPTYVPVTTSKPIYVPAVKVVKVKKPKTIVRVNDYHPFLTTKLGAQCTCSSNTVKLRKPTKAPLAVSVEDYSSNDQYLKEVTQKNYEPEYIQEVTQKNYEPQYIQEVTERSYKPLSEEYIRVEDEEDEYNYEPQRIVEVSSRAPEYVISSTTPTPQPVYAVRKRVKVARPIVVGTPDTIAFREAPIVKAVTSTTRVPEIFLQKRVRPTVTIVADGIDDDEPINQNERELTAAVRKGLRALKNTVKEGVKEALDGHRFDRYGPGGWRSRDETLQGTVDCQRAGLFRHPSHCNKFYACRWDCTKNRFTLHVFNCPVHLTFDGSLGACNWPSQGPACVDNTLLPSD